MDEIISKILGIILSAAASGVVSGVAVWFKMRRKKDDAVADGVQCLLREKIIEKHTKYVEEKHYCPIYAKESIRKAYNAYHALGGNDVATALYKELMALHTEPPEKGGAL